MSDLPDSDDPRPWLAAVDQLEGEVDQLATWRASVAVDGEAATIRRALDGVLGEPATTFVEVGPGQVVELDRPE